MADNRNSQRNAASYSGSQSSKGSGSGRARQNDRQRQSAKHQSKASRKRKRRRRRIRRLICLILIVIILAAGFLYDRFRSYDSYTVSAAVGSSGAGSFIEIESFAGGYVKITESSVTYFNKNGVSWSESYSMTQPVYDICKGYLAVGDMKQSEVYIFDKDGLAGIVSAQYQIIDIEVSKAGVIACATDDDEANYIEVYDKEGNEILTARSVFSSSGYLADITLSADGTKLAAAFINVDLLEIVSRVVFYDFSGADDDSDVIVGGFNQYTDTVLTNVEFLGSDKVVAVGDNAYTVYDFSDTPEIVYEDLELDYTIENVFFSDKYFGFVIDDPSGTYNYEYLVYDRKGEVAAQAGFDFLYTDIQLSGKSIILNSDNACRIYTFSGYERFSCAFEENITAIYPAGYAGLIYVTSSETYFIKMK